MQPQRQTPVPKLPAPKHGILEITPYKPGKSKAGGKPVMKLSANENALGPSPKAIEAYQAAAKTLHRYPDGGQSVLREAIAETYGLDPASIICGAGSDELIGLLIHAYAGEGDEVLYSAHGFLMYKIYALGNGATPVAAPEKNLCADVDALLKAVTPRTRIVFIANPNNPTGSYLTRTELKRLRDSLPSEVILAVDAAYAEYVEEKDYSDGLELVKESENTVMLRTFSKIHALPALRLGWMVAPSHIIDIINRVRGPFNVGTPALVAGAAAVRDAAHVENSRRHNAEWRNWLTKEIAALDFKVYPSVGNFILVEFPVSGSNAAAKVNDYLTSCGIIPREVGEYGLPDCLRITIGLEAENRALIDCLKKFLKRS
jgi:histidinol-phosphate aminotransferase